MKKAKTYNSNYSYNWGNYYHLFKFSRAKGMVTLKKGNFDGKPLPIELHHYPR